MTIDTLLKIRVRVLNYTTCKHSESLKVGHVSPYTPEKRIRCPHKNLISSWGWRPTTLSVVDVRITVTVYQDIRSLFYLPYKFHNCSTRLPDIDGHEKKHNISTSDLKVYCSQRKKERKNERKEGRQKIRKGRKGDKKFLIPLVFKRIRNV